jgi:hypothetical protein
MHLQTHQGYLTCETSSESGWFEVSLRPKPMVDNLPSES